MNKLHVLTAEPQGEGLVEMIESLLQDAKDGKISSLAVAYVDREGCINTAWERPPSMGLLIGAVAQLQYRLNSRLNES